MPSKELNKEDQSAAEMKHTVTHKNKTWHNVMKLGFVIIGVMILLAQPASHVAAEPAGTTSQAQQFAESQAKANSIKALRSQTNTNREMGQDQAASEALGWYATSKAWLLQKQIEISRTLNTYLEQFKNTNDYTFAALLIGASLLYGLVHAAGPGHGKIVVSSYVMANNQTLKRGIVLAFLSSLVQASVAVGLVGSLAYIFQASGSTIKSVSHQFTQASYLLICLLGLYLLYTVIKRRWQSNSLAKKPAHAHQTADQPSQERCGCGHSHIPNSKELEGKWDTAKVISLVLSVGLRPCTGALYVLAFALVKGVFWVGAVAVYAMALGTAMTISLMTTAVVTGRQMALFTSQGNSRTITIITDIFSFAGALAILALGLFLLSTSQAGLRPF